jgi:hypothetical protein
VPAPTQLIAGDEFDFAAAMKPSAIDRDWVCLESGGGCAGSGGAVVSAPQVAIQQHGIE